MIIMKFGGTSVGSKERIFNVANIILKFNSNQIIIVVSAMAGVTDKLISLFEKYKVRDYLSAHSELVNLYAIHKLGLDDKSIHRLFEELNIYLTLCTEFKPADYDHVISFGEKLSSHLLSAAINSLGIKSNPIDSSSIIITDNNFGNGKALLDQTETKAKSVISPLLSQNVIPIITGFFGANLDGEIVTLGRGGSDYSATILANVLDASEVILWKEVDGIFSDDPKKTNNAIFYPSLTYDEALELSKNGAKILHPEAMIPVQAKNIIVRVKNTFNPDHPGTKIWKSK